MLVGGIIAGIYAMLALWFAWLIARAPEGYEIEGIGFRYGREPIGGILGRYTLGSWEIWREDGRPDDEISDDTRSLTAPAPGAKCIAAGGAHDEGGE